MLGIQPRESIGLGAISSNLYPWNSTDSSTVYNERLCMVLRASISTCVQYTMRGSESRSII